MIKALARSIAGRLGLSGNGCRFPYEHYQQRLNCLFIHIPKTAGTSLLSALGKQGMYGRRHLPWSVYQMADPVYFAKAFKFAFVRNPYDRLNSAYRYYLNGGNRVSDGDMADLIRKYSNLDDFVTNGLCEQAFKYHSHFIPQSHYVTELNGRIMVDFVGRYERIDDDFDFIRKTLGIRRSLPILNMGPDAVSSTFRAAYRGSQAIDMVASIYKQDMRLFGYSFDQ